MSTHVIAIKHEGDVVLIKVGVPPARIVPVASISDRVAAQRAVEGLKAASRGVTLGGIPIRDLVNDGRA